MTYQFSSRFSEQLVNPLLNGDAEPIVMTVPDCGRVMLVVCRACLPRVSAEYVPLGKVPSSVPYTKVTLYYGHFVERRPGKKADGTDYAVEVDYFAYLGCCPKCGQWYVAKIAPTE